MRAARPRARSGAATSIASTHATARCACRDDFRRPNGLAFSPDETPLYIADSGFWPNPDWPHHIRAFEVADDKLDEGRVVAEVSPESQTASVSISTATFGRARAMGCIASRRKATAWKNSCAGKSREGLSGGPKRDRLFICGLTSLYAIHLNTRGAQKP